MLDGDPRQEPDPVLPSGMSLFPTGSGINETITGHVCALVPYSLPLCIPSPSSVLPLLSLPLQWGVERKGGKEKDFPFFNFAFNF